MGAQQSTSSGQHSVGTPGAAKTCYYELLAIDRQATDEEIKKAYRRKALELHPDRNIDNVAVATQKFAEVQAAYEVLSDPQERAWYDSHRDAILRGADDSDVDDHPTTFHNVRLTTTEEIHKLMTRFNSTIPFTDDPTGFFGVALETFEQLALEEMAAAKFDRSESAEYPTFGSSDDLYETTVKPFYNAWSGFCTKKSFSWKDKYRLSDAQDRRVRRLMEKENKRLREEAIRDFNDAVRFLVVFVRKRDPRYLPNTQTQAERQESMRAAAAAQAAKARAANQEKLEMYEAPAWSQTQDDSAQDDHFPETEEESEKELLECVVCNKTFKSEKQLQVHEQSKKHVKAVQKLRWRMRKEGADLDLDEGQNGDPCEAGEESPKPADSDTGSTEVLGPEEDSASNDSQKGHTGTPQEERAIPNASSGEDTSGDDDYASRSVIQDRLAPRENDKSDGTSSGDDQVDRGLSVTLEKTSMSDSQPQKKTGKAKAKREKRAAQNAQEKTASIGTFRCTICQDQFPSRTRLFQHIRDEGHAAPLDRSQPGGGKQGRKRR